MENKKTQVSLSYYKTMLILYEKHFNNEELFTMLVDMMEAVEETNTKKLRIVFDCIGNKIKELEGIE